MSKVEWPPLQIEGVTDNRIRRILTSQMRANPQFTFIPRSRFSEVHRSQFSDLLADISFAGLLVPAPGSGLTMKALDHASAQVFERFRENSACPNDLLAQGSIDEVCQAFLRFITTGVLQVETEQGFTSGEMALVSFFDLTKISNASPSDFIHQISIDAIRYAQDLPIEDAGRLSARIYFYNRKPVVSEKLARNFYSSVANQTRALLNGADVSKGFRAVLSSEEGWLFFTSARHRSANRQQHGNFKLYISPENPDLLERLELLIRVILRHEPLAFKIGVDSEGLQRPDKLIVYCDNFASIKSLSKDLAELLEDCKPHGVPFTANLFGDGLLSWGFDPAPDRFTITWLEKESWRLWLTNRIASSLLFARKQELECIEPWQFALIRLEIDNVDTSRWVTRQSVAGKKE